MKTATCTLLSFSILFWGCFVESSITRDEPAPDDSKVFFYLKDGSCVKSYSDHHHRVEDGYQIAGIITAKGGFPKDFTGIIHDADIERISVEEFNLGGTVIGGLLGAGLVTAVILLHLGNHL